MEDEEDLSVFVGVLFIALVLFVVITLVFRS